VVTALAWPPVARLVMTMRAPTAGVPSSLVTTPAMFGGRGGAGGVAGAGGAAGADGASDEWQLARQLITSPVSAVWARRNGIGIPRGVFCTTDGRQSRSWTQHEAPVVISVSLEEVKHTPAAMSASCCRVNIRTVSRLSASLFCLPSFDALAPETVFFM
jgi:hypothetical protein